jgi:hypothetical protein
MSNLGKLPTVVHLLLFLMLLVASPLVQGAILNNGDTGPPSFLTPGGTLLATMSGAITTPTFTTSYTTWVYSDPNNTFCPGCLDFTYRFTNQGPDVNERFTAFNFVGFKVDAGFDPSTPGNAPLTVDRAMSGEVIGFNYTGNDTVISGQTTPVLVIETNATKWVSGFVSAQDGTAGYGAAFAPSAIPEPSSLGLVGGGVLIIGGFLRRFTFGKTK